MVRSVGFVGYMYNVFTTRENYGAKVTSMSLHCSTMVKLSPARLCGN